jgi:hypothetical protein
MTVLVASRPLVVHEVTGTARRSARATAGYEVRAVTLAAIGYLLGVHVADFDCLRVAAALEDIECCPCCRGRPLSGT